MAAPLRGPVEDEDELARQVKIHADPNAIKVDYQEVPSVLARWNHRLVEASKVLKLAEAELEAARERAELEASVTEEKLRLHYLKELGKVSLDIRGAHVVTDPKYIAARENVIATVRNHKRIVAEAAAAKGRAAAMVANIDAKKEMLISLGAHIRLEMGRDASIRENPRRG